MADILIKNVPKEIHEKLKAMAIHHHRSMTKQALAVLEEAAAQYSAGTGAQSAKRISRVKKEREERRRLERWIEWYAGILAGKEDHGNKKVPPMERLTERFSRLNKDKRGGADLAQLGRGMEMVRRLTGKGTVRMTTGEILKLTRGE